MRLLAISAAMALALGTGGSARAADGEMYRWLDAEGRVHFGGEPPADARSVAPWSPAGERVRIAPPAAEAPSPHAQTGPAPATAAPPAAEAEERLGGRTATQWRQQARSLEQQIQRFEREIDDFEESTHASGGWGTHREGGVVQLIQVPDKRKELEREREQAESDLEALEEEARRLGVPPGWLR